MSSSETQPRFTPFVPVVLWLAVVFGLGSSGFSSDDTSRFLRPFLEWLLPDWRPWEIRQILWWVRKSAHVVEYAVVALLMFRAMALTRPGWTARRLAMPAIALVVAVACLDELRQSFLTTRTGTVSDVLLDTAGGVLGAAFGPWFVALERRLRGG